MLFVALVFLFSGGGGGLLAVSVVNVQLNSIAPPQHMWHTCTVAMVTTAAVTGILPRFASWLLWKLSLCILLSNITRD